MTDLLETSDTYGTPADIFENHTSTDPGVAPETDGPDEDGATHADDVESYLDQDADALWEGDQGSLDARQRDTLVALLKKAFISSDDRTEWRTLNRDRAPIVTSLNNLYFDLVIDDRSEVAYATPARTSDNLFRTLVRDAPNSREETLLLIYLRERFRAATAAGEPHVYTDTITMHEYVQRFRPPSATDQLGDERRVTNAIAGLVTAGLLVKTKNEGRYRIHRAIEALLPLTKLSQLLDAFRRHAGSEPDPNDDTNPTCNPTAEQGSALAEHPAENLPGSPAGTLAEDLEDLA